jgi:hypothetical protein
MQSKARMSETQIKTDSFDNFAGIAQVIGRVGTAQWMFHARSGHWEFHVVEAADRAPTCALPEDGDYWEAGEYESKVHITNEKASNLLGECLQRYLKARRLKKA